MKTLMHLFPHQYFSTCKKTLKEEAGAKEDYIHPLSSDGFISEQDISFHYFINYSGKSS